MTDKDLENIPAGIYDFALVLTKRLVSNNLDGRRHFDLILVKDFHDIFIFFQCYLCLYQ